jgi:uncharacterized protein (UPF0335 family)
VTACLDYQTAEIAEITKLRYGLYISVMSREAASDRHGIWRGARSTSFVGQELCYLQPRLSCEWIARASGGCRAFRSTGSSVQVMRGTAQTGHGAVSRTRELRLRGACFRSSVIRQRRGFSLTRWSFFCVHFHDLIQQRGTMSDISIPGGRIRSFVERIEHIDTELQELNESKKEVFAEAKGEGFDVKILKEIIKLRKQDKDERDERDTLLDMYMRAMETAGPELTAKAA